MEGLIDLPTIKPFRLYDENDDFFLNLTAREKGSAPREWGNYSFSSPEFALESAILYSYHNLGFAAKMFLNVDLLPYQILTLECLFNHQFPMLIGSRGLGKCVRDCYIMTNNGIRYINDMFSESEPCMEKAPTNESLFGENGFSKAEYKWKNSSEFLKKVSTNNGYSISCTKNHPIRIVRNGKIEWVNAEDVKIGDYIPIDRTDNWFENTNDLSEDLAYLFGCLIGDGGYTVRGRITFTNIDNDLIKKVENIFYKKWGKKFKRGYKPIDYIIYGTAIWDELFDKYGFNSSACGEKQFPQSVMSSSKKSMAAFIRGLFDTDGYVSKRDLIIEYCSKSEKLVTTLQYVLTKFGIISKIFKKRNKKYDKDYYHLVFFGKDVKIFNEKIGFGLKRKAKILNKNINKKTNTNKDIIPMDMVKDNAFILKEKLKLTEQYKNLTKYEKRRLNITSLDQHNLSYNSLQRIMEFFLPLKDEPEYKNLSAIINSHYFYDKVESIDEEYGESYDFYIPNDHSFITNGIISHNSFLLSIYALLRAVLLQGSRVALISSSFRQSKIMFNYINDVYKRSPFLQQICGGEYPKFDVSACRFKIGNSTITALPLGDGQKIRGERANCILVDEFASINEEIFQVVVRGFGAVSLDPVQKVKEKFRLKALEKRGVDISSYKQRTKNQILIGGTAYYQFNHFYQWLKRYEKIIACNNDKKKLREIMGDEATEEDLMHLDTNEFCVLKVPYTHVPILEESMIAQAKATMSAAKFAMEYGAEFYADSEGFIPRSLIEATSLLQKYSPLILGQKGKRYIMGVDPARKRDHFSIVIIEIDDTGSRRHKVVYCWATNESKMKKSGEVNENQTYYAACARKIRQLLTRFNVSLIMMDAGGGGESIAELLSDKAQLKGNEKPIWSMDDPEQRLYDGLHLLKLISSSPSWAATANHAFRKSIEDFNLLFPVFDTVEIEKDINNNPDLYSEEFMNKIINKVKSFMIDSLESISEEIEHLKEEVSSIVITTTAGNNEHFDLPKLAAPGQIKTEDRRRKDRYSACLLAHSGISEICTENIASSFKSVGGTSKSKSGESKSGSLYRGLPAGTKVMTTGRNISIVKKNGGSISF